MSSKFQTGVRFNHNLGPQETLAFLGEGVGAALFMVALFIGEWLLALPGILFVAGAVVALLKHLGRPDRAWRATARVASSWVSRGTLFIGAFIGIAVLSVAARLLGMGALEGTLAVFASIVALPVMAYGGMLLRSMRAVRLWRGPYLPLAFVAHSLASGLILAWALISLFADAVPPAWLQPVAVVALVASVLVSALHLLGTESSEGVRASFDRILAGDLRSSFLLGGGVCGVVVPLIGLAVLPATSGVVASLLMSIVALCRLYGDFAYRKAIVVAGAYEPVMPGWQMRTFVNPPPTAPVSGAPSH